jgi:hypothetical protein
MLQKFSYRIKAWLFMDINLKKSLSEGSKERSLNLKRAKIIAQQPI